MNPFLFDAPSLEMMNHLLPAFEFSAVVDRGGVSAVYAARQRSLDRDVAIKVLSPQVGQSPEFRQVFEVTARAMAKLSHPNLIRVFDSGMVEGMLFFVMEYIPGKSLAYSARGQRVETQQALSLIEGVCCGLAHAHDHGIVHGCVEPAVILLNQKAEPKLGNFGFNYQIVSGGDAESLLHFYQAPEVVSGSVDPSPRADIYAVGAVLYELLSGCRHVEGGDPPSVHSDCGQKIDDIWRKATHSDPDLRYQEMHEFHRDVAAILDESRVVSEEVEVAGPPAARMASAASVVRRSRAASVWVMVRTVMIIAGIGYGGWVGWGYYQRANERQELEKRKAIARDEEKKKQEMAAEKKRAAEVLARRTPVKPSVPEQPAPVVPKPETAEESLTRLAVPLAAGKRDEMPVGCVMAAGSGYLLVRKALSWPEAAVFAERHGAHLAVPSAAADLTWLMNHVADGQTVWIGAGRCGANDWSLVDGSMWKPVRVPSGAGNYVSVNKDGLLRAANGKESLSFIMQWHLDGKNPGSVTELLDKAGATQGKSDAYFLPGTRMLDGRRFLVVLLPVTWDQAVELAKKSGGHLAVATTAGEVAALDVMADDVMADDVVADDGLWIGGSLQDKEWKWITGEAWTTAKWAKDAVFDESASAAVVRPGKSWAAVTSNSKASGFIIEWSDDHQAKPAVVRTSVVGDAQRSGDMVALTAKAKELILAAQRKRLEQLASNVRKFVGDLDAHVRSLPRTGQETWRPEVEVLKEGIVDSRLPGPVFSFDGPKLNTVMEGIVKYGIKKQEQIDEEFLTAAGKLHGAYLAKIRELIAAAKQAGQEPLAESLTTKLKECDQLEPWIRSFGVEPKPEVVKPEVEEPNRQPLRPDVPHEPRRDRQPPRDGGSLIE